MTLAVPLCPSEGAAAVPPRTPLSFPIAVVLLCHGADLQVWKGGAGKEEASCASGFLFTEHVLFPSLQCLPNGLKLLFIPCCCSPAHALPRCCVGMEGSVHCTRNCIKCMAGGRWGSGVIILEDTGWLE